jgi:hypothetical protein
MVAYVMVLKGRPASAAMTAAPEKVSAEQR